MPPFSPVKRDIFPVQARNPWLKIMPPTNYRQLSSKNNATKYRKQIIALKYHTTTKKGLRRWSLCAILAAVNARNRRQSGGPALFFDILNDVAAVGRPPVTPSVPSPAPLRAWLRSEERG
jgi:hypothetical protein